MFEAEAQLQQQQGTMSEPDPSRSARAMYALILHKCSRETTQTAIADALGTSPATINRLLNQELVKLCQLLDAVGMRIVPKTERTYPEDYVQSLRVMARRGMDAELPDGDGA